VDAHLENYNNPAEILKSAGSYHLNSSKSDALKYHEIVHR
jgi:hypothetical protein